MLNPFTGMIMGAGWKMGMVASRAPVKISPRCPELLMPIGHGETVISRLTCQLRLLGAEEIYVAVGSPDTYNVLAYEKQVAESSGYVCSDGQTGEPVWSWERVEGVRELGVRVVPINNPLIFGSRFKTARSLLASREGYRSGVGRVIMLAGDYVFDTPYLRELVTGAIWPSILWLLPMHEVMFLNQRGRSTWLAWARAWLAGRGFNFLGRHSLWKDRETLDAMGIPSISLDEEERNRIAPYIGHASLRLGDVPLFTEISPNRVSWEAAFAITAKDPCGR